MKSQYKKANEQFKVTALSYHFVLIFKCTIFACPIESHSAYSYQHMKGLNHEGAYSQFCVIIQRLIKDKYIDYLFQVV